MVSSLEEASQYAAGPGAPPVSLHLAVDTGMGRIGVWERDAVALAEALCGIAGVRVCGVGSHFPSADEDAGYTAAQADVFARLTAELRARGLVAGPAHIANSAGVIGFPETAGELYRAGLALYGCSPLAEFQAALRPVLSWKARVSLVRDFEAGRSVSYGRTFVTGAPTRVATVTVGYADGYRRHLSGRGAGVLVGGRRCPVLGRVTMDQIMVDVTAVDGVAAGDEVVLIGESGGQGVSVSEMASISGTIPWEIFTGIGARVRRVGVD
jgi:alanine racemase